MVTMEKATDLWVGKLLDEAGISLDPQKSSINELDDALKTASKKGSNNYGFPEFIGIVKDFIIVIENKRSVHQHVRYDKNDIISMDPKDVVNCAINGALFYGIHLSQETSYKKILAIAVSGGPKDHKITPIYIDELGNYKELPEVETFIYFNEDNIDEYYTRVILDEDTDNIKETKELLAKAAELHQYLASYGTLKEMDKPLVVSGILLALKEAEYGNFSIDDLKGDTVNTDGMKIYSALEDNLKRARVAPEVKKDKILSQFSIIKDSAQMNTTHKDLGETPLKFYTKFLNNNLYKQIKFSLSSEDYIGRFYGEFMSYSGGDGQSLGIILTPKHITDLFCDLLDVTKDDTIFDPCCGTGGFLISAMHKMLKEANSSIEKEKIRETQLHGIELQSYMFTIATTNMILRGDGRSNLINENFLEENPNQLQLNGNTVGMINPPYSQGTKKSPDLYELNFVKHLLDSCVRGGRVAAIIPQSSMTGKTTIEKRLKEKILEEHTLEGVISLNKDTFYRVGVIPCIAVFTTGVSHPEDKEAKFINFEDDGYEVSKHIGLLETERAKDRRQYLLDVWNDRIESDNSFCVKSIVDYDDEWLHSFYYFNGDIPTDDEFEKTIGDYLSFEFSMIMQNRDYLFEQEGDNDES